MSGGLAFRMGRQSTIAGRRVRLTLEAPVEVGNNLGGAAISFAPVATIWARIELGRGGENVVGERLEARAEARITLRWRANLDPRMRFSGASRLFAIRSVFDPDGSRRNLVCLCQEISP